MLKILIFLLCATNALAKCRMGYMDFWPKSKTISQNAIFVIDGYGFSQKIVENLNFKYPIYLQSGQIKVRLIVKEILVGEAGLTQAKLNPENELIPGKTYQLRIYNLPHDSDSEAKLWNAEKRKFEFPSWTVKKGIDLEKPVWMIMPTLSHKTFISFGCGPEYYVHFNFQALDQSEILLQTTVANLLTNEVFTYYLHPDEFMTVKVGKGMCYGAFGFFGGNEFEVSFDIMDASGNTTKWYGDKIKFTKPMMGTGGF